MTKPDRHYLKQLDDMLVLLKHYKQPNDISDKSVLLFTYDETDELPSEIIANGNSETIGQQLLVLFDKLPADTQIMVLAHLVQDYEDAIKDIIEMKNGGNQ